MTIRKDQIRAYGTFLLFLLAMILPAAPDGAAQSNPGSVEERIKVVAHLALPKMHVNQMFVQQRGEKHYLYLHRPTRQAFALVDVSKPDKPVLLERAILQEPEHGRVSSPPSESALAITVTAEDHSGAGGDNTKPPAAPAPVVLPTETVRLVDLSDPKHPKTLKTFKNVTSMLPDDSRKLIYIANDEGLWIVSHKQVQPMPFCTSAMVMTPNPNCQ
jgi:hypothetical protein